MVVNDVPGCTLWYIVLQVHVRSTQPSSMGAVEVKEVGGAV